MLVLYSPIASADFEADISAASDSLPALRELRLKAGAGDAQAQLDLGNVFFKGKDLAQDYAEAEKWFRLAAHQGVAEAQYNLGMMYATGRGVAQNLAESVSWYRLAADQHLAIAELNLGVAYNYGEGVEKNEAEALKWFRLAAEQNEAVAQFNLAVMYLNGQGVQPNLHEAYRWAKLSADHGYEIARALLDDLEQRMASPARAGKTAARAARTTVASDQQNGIYLQLGAFKTQEQAADFMTRMQEKLGDTGKPYGLFSSYGWVRVQSGPYADANEARQAAADLKSRLGFEPKLRQR